MNDSEQSGHADDETKIDSLLREFFRQEVPFAKAGGCDGSPADDVPRLVEAGQVNRGRRERAAGLFGLSAAAGSLLAALLLLSSPPFTQRDDDSRSKVTRAEALAEQSTAAGGLKVENRPAGGRTAPDVSIAVTEDESAIEQYETANGPVEQRSRWRIKNVLILDAASGEEVELSLPELEIEIFPIGDDE